jgi:predicted transcriptional regulator
MTDEPKGQGISDGEPVPRLWAYIEERDVLTPDRTLQIKAAGPILRFENRAIPASIRALFRHPGQPLVGLTIERIEGRFACTGLHLSTLPGRVIDRDVVRGVRVERLVRTATANAVHVVHELSTETEVELMALLMDVEQLPVPDLRIGDAYAWPSAGPELAEFARLDHAMVSDPKRTRAAARRARLQVIAETYDQALKDGESTTRAVMSQQNVSYQHAKNLIGDTREAGFLPKTTRGKKRGTIDALGTDG